MNASGEATFAIVGHPNKGKSSIVATLAQDSSVDISPLSATTTVHQAYPMQVDGKIIYRLVDTPGFQRARAAMDWMVKQNAPASQRRAIVEQFVEFASSDERFSAEVELLTPIIEGAGIIYVVDGSRPYGPEYDTEMEILRWTGRPSMALINRIDEADYTAEWQQSLSQYFKIVRSFNAQSASFDRQIQLLTGFSELHDDWYQPLQKAAEMLREQRQSRCDEAVSEIISSVTAMLGYVYTTATRSNQPDAARQKHIARFQQEIRNMESSLRTSVEAIFNYSDIDREENAIQLIEDDLFSDDTWKVFGLSRDQLMTGGIIGGATAGATVDIGSGGFSMFAGSSIGALLGGASAWFGSKQLVSAKIPGLPVGSNELVIGPVENPNFAWVLIGRAVNHLVTIMQRTHARRDTVDLKPASEHAINKGISGANLSASVRGRMTAAFRRARKSQAVSAADREKLGHGIHQLVDAGLHQHRASNDGAS